MVKQDQQLTIAQQLAVDIKDNWKGLGYGWKDQERAKETTLDYLPKPANGQEIGINNWGIEGKRHQGSKLYILGVWANILEFYYEAYFDNFSRAELDKMILWAQQDPGLISKGNKVTADDEISQILILKKDKPVHEVKEELKKNYLKDKTVFLNSQWSSLINAAGPEIKIVDEKGDFIELDSICGRLSELRPVNLDQYSSVCNMAWLEEFYTRLDLPGMIYDHLNFDELVGLYCCIKVRESLMVDDNFLIRHHFKGNMAPGVSSVISKIFNDLVYTFFKVVRNLKDERGSTWKTFRSSSSNHTPEISGILKKSGSDITLTGTGKELFYLLSKGATPIICGEGLFLIPHIAPELIRANAITTMKAKLAQIDENTRNALVKHYKYPEAKSYGKLFRTSFESPFSPSLSSNQMIPVEKLHDYPHFNIVRDFENLMNDKLISNARN